jgi:hypothetical protein
VSSATRTKKVDTDELRSSEYIMTVVFLAAAPAAEGSRWKVLLTAIDDEVGM